MHTVNWDCMHVSACAVADTGFPVEEASTSSGRGGD